jgi:streptogramin lyase
VAVPGGDIWFTEPGANKIARINTSGVTVDYAIPTAASSPQGITFGPDGNLWFTEAAADKIGVINTSGAVVAEYTIPTAACNPQGITPGPDGDLWFTEAAAGKIAKIVPSTGQVTEYPVTTPGGQPDGITLGPDGNLWFTEAAANQIGKIVPATGVVTEYPISTPGGRPQGIAPGPDGNLWFTEAGAARIGKISPATGAVTDYAVATPGGVTEGIASGSDGNLWFTEPGKEHVGRITPSGVVTEFATPTAASQPWGITTGPDGNPWFTEAGANKVGQVTLTQLIQASGTTLTTQVGSSFAVTIASFTSASVNAQTANFTATIDWGDGSSPSAGTITATAPGRFNVSATKTYSAAGNYQAQVTIRDLGGTSATANSAVAVTLASSDGTINAVEGQLFSGQVASFSDLQTTGAAAQYSATISWADGTTSTGVIRSGGGTTFTVSGSHTYAEEGVDPVTVTVTAPNNRTFSASAQAVVADAPLHASAAAIQPTAGVLFSGVVATFTDDDPMGAVADYQATIVWGDGHTSAGTIAAPAGAGYFTVTGSNTYTAPGSYTLQVTIMDVGGSAVTTAPSTVSVGGVPVYLSGHLNPASISGPSKTANITNVNRPTFEGITAPFSMVQLYAQQANSDPTAVISLGQTMSGPDGAWSLTAPTLPDGSYTVSASITSQAGFPTAPVLIVTPDNPLVIDTIAPRVTGLAFDPKTGMITVVIGDAWSGLYANSLMNPANYIIVRKRGLAGSHSQSVALTPGISGFYTGAQSATLQFTAPLAPGRYQFMVKSGGVIDEAGNALDGEFTGKLPSGNGHPGGNFIVQLTVPRHRTTPHSRALRKTHGR